MPSRIDPDFGTIEFIHSTRAKKINVRILKDKLRVSLPPHATEEEALRFIESVRNKIASRQNKVKNTAERNNLVLNNGVRLETLTFTAEVKAAERKDIFLALKSGMLIIEFPRGMDCLNESVQAQLWTGLNYFLRKEAKRVLPGRTKMLADKYGFTYSSVKIQSSTSRWGSCSQEKNINLSFYLMLLPQHLVDYVILHELCHTKEMNHSVHFWQWMDRVTDGQSKMLRTELKQHTMPAAT